MPTLPQSNTKDIIYQTTYTTVNNNLDPISELIKNQGILLGDNTRNKYQKFKRFHTIDASDDLLVGPMKEYVFLTKPNLNIFSDSAGTVLNGVLADSPEFVDILNRFPHVVQQLQFNLTTHSSPFLNALSFKCNNTLDISDLNSKDIKSAQNIYGTSISYRSHSYESDQAQSFSLEFQENINTEIYLFFKLWDIYSNLKSDGLIDPPSILNLENQISHDKIAAFKFITVGDASQILFFAKEYGVYPDGAPRGGFSNVEGLITHAVPFKSDFVEDTNPEILEDFNELVSPYLQKVSSDDNSFYNTELQMPNFSLPVIPYIKKIDNNYFLKWKGGNL